MPKLKLPTINDDASWGNWYNVYNVGSFKAGIIDQSFPYADIPASSSVTYDLQKARYKDSEFFLIALNDLTTDKVQRTCGINTNFTYTKPGHEDIPAVYAGDKKFY